MARDGFESGSYNTLRYNAPATNTLANANNRGFGTYGYTDEELGLTPAKLRALVAQSGGKKTEQDIRERYGFDKKYNEDPAFKKMTNDNRVSGWDRIKGHVDRIGSGVEDFAKNAGPTAAAMAGLGYLSAAGAAGGAYGGTGYGSYGAAGGEFGGAGVATTGGMGGVGGAYGGTVGVGAPTAMTGTGVTGMGGVGATTLAGGGSLGSSLLTHSPSEVVAGASGGVNALGAGSALGGLGWDDALIAGSGLASGYLTNQATGDAMGEIGRQYDQNRADLEPWRQAGVNALGKLENFNIEDDPIYQHQLSESDRALQRAMAARGYNNSGNLLDAVSKNAIGEAGRYQNDIWNRYAGLAGVGQNAVNTGVTSGTNSANNLSNLQMQRGQGYNNAIQGTLSNYMLKNYLNRGY